LSAVVVGALIASACSASTPPRPEPRPPELEIGFTQILPEEGTDRGLLRVINHEARPVTVTAVGLSWSGYGDVLEPTDGENVVPAESELMLRVKLPPPHCTVTGDPPAAPVRARLVVDGLDVTDPLTGPAQTYVQRLWRTQCDRQLLRRSLRIRFAAHPRVVAGPRGHRVDSPLVLTRLDSNQPVHVLSADGSVLYDLRVPNRTMPTSLGSTRLPLAILPGNYCHEHAIGQATAPFDFSLTLRLGDRRILHLIRPPQPVTSAASKMLRRHCGGAPR
jgi:hypothetical protein